MVEEPTGPVTTPKLLGEYSISSQLASVLIALFLHTGRLFNHCLRLADWLSKLEKNTRFSPDIKIQLVQVIAASIIQPLLRQADWLQIFTRYEKIELHVVQVIGAH